ncbi:MAG: hypothetical protein JWM78_3871 [Verrucomicrobiaceae bacterium]|nr:hypothetical protein [Verrucomicrobiaceae bacterium]
MYAERSTRHHSETRALARSIRWFDHSLNTPTRTPLSLRPWLLAEGSLTQHLLHLSGGDFRVERISQRWCRPTLSEALLLNIAPDQWALIREVILWGCGEPWVYARSVMPASSLRGDLQRLRRLRNTSLGALLFKYPQLQRAPFELAQIDAALLPQSLRGANTVWGRRSRFSVDARHLIVGEIFLDAFVQAATQSLYRPQ